MIKKQYCEHCEHQIITEYICDTCGQTLTQGIPIQVDFSYGSSLDGLEVHFCDFKCAINFLQKEKNKHQPDTRFELGI